MKDSSEFMTAVAAVARPWETFTSGDGKPGTRIRSEEEIAAAIFAMPEMQAIQSTLLWVIECFGSGNDELPDSVYDWACEAS